MVVLDLEPGEVMLPDTEADRAAWLMPIAGEVELRDACGARALAGPATRVELEPAASDPRTDAPRLVLVAPAGRPAPARGETAASRA